ncbi:Glycosidase [Sarracenia purpurea var. burkii]
MLLEDQLLNDHHDQPHSLNLPAGPDILGVTGDEEGNLKASLGGLMRKYGTETVDLPRLYHMGVASSSPQIVNVDYFGAKGDGITDDSEAFKKAWEEACMGKDAVLVVPKQRTYHLKPVTFSGPCNSGLTMKVS